MAVARASGQRPVTGWILPPSLEPQNLQSGCWCHCPRSRARKDSPHGRARSRLVDEKIRRLHPCRDRLGGGVFNLKNPTIPLFTAGWAPPGGAKGCRGWVVVSPTPPAAPPAGKQNSPPAGQGAGAQDPRPAPGVGARVEKPAA